MPNTLSLDNIAQQIDQEVSINPLVIKIGGQIFNHYTSFNIKRTLTEFIDTFTITCDNPAGLYARNLHMGMSFQAYFSGVEIFKGLIENKKSTWSRVGGAVTFSGREELASLAEDDIDPSFGPFIGTTDNDILNLVMFQFPWQTDFAEAAPILNYDISGGSTRKAQVIVDVARKNNFFVWKKGTIIYKKKLPESGSSVKETMVFSAGVNSRGKWTDKILNLTVNEDISSVRSTLIAATVLANKFKEGPTYTLENATIKNGTYHKVIRNLSDEPNVLKIDRTRYVAYGSSMPSETSALLERSIKETNISASVEVILSGFHDFDITDTVLVDAEPENIYNTFYVSTIQYNFDRNNKRTTTLTLTPLGYLPI